MHSLAACIAGLVVLVSPGSDPNKKPPARPQSASAVKLMTADKVNLKGDLVIPTNTTKQYPRSAAVILIHGGEGTRSEMWGLQRKITDWGAATLALDLRGHGESNGNGRAGAQAVPAAGRGKGQPDEASVVLNPLQEDIKSAVVYLRKQKGIDPNRISLLGVDLGAAAAVRYAASDLGIKGVGYISPEAEIPGFDLQTEAKKISPRSLFVLAPLSAKERTEALTKALEGSCKVYPVVANGEARGCALLDIQKTTEEKLTTELGLKLWLRDLGALTPGP